MTSDAFAQTRRSDGGVPIASVQLLDMNGEPCAALQMQSLSFRALPPTKVDRFGAGNAAQTDAVRGRAAMTLVDLSACATVRAGVSSDIGASGLQLQVAAEGLAKFAAVHGPLVAREPFAYGGEADEIDPAHPFEETASLWASAAVMANLAVVMQECANGALLLEAVPASLGNMVLWRVNNPQTGSNFDLFTIARPLDADYAEWLGVPRFIRREETKDRINYAFILGDPAADGTVEVVLASFDHEITASDYRLLGQALNLTPAVDREARERLLLDESDLAATDAEDAGDYRLDAETLSGYAAQIEESDLPQLASLVRALVAAHLGDAYVDVFSAGGATGYLSFRSYLSWLWYDFSCNLGAVRVKYCVRCGRAFSVAGRRGPEKNYCSNDCRDAAHNERVGTKRDELRQAFLKDGAKVADLARAYYPDDDPAVGAKRVISLLESWPALKHEVDNDIEKHGWRAPLFVRCHAEGLNIVKLLSSKRRRQLKASRTKA